MANSCTVITVRHAKSQYHRLQVLHWQATDCSSVIHTRSRTRITLVDAALQQSQRLLISIPAHTNEHVDSCSMTEESNMNKNHLWTTETLHLSCKPCKWQITSDDINTGIIPWDEVSTRVYITLQPVVTASKLLKMTLRQDMHTLYTHSHISRIRV